MPMMGTMSAALKAVSLLAITLPKTVALSEQQLLNQTYDYIIVGGGTSGLTVANRLTANGKRKFFELFLHGHVIDMG